MSTPRTGAARRDELTLSIGGVVAHVELLGANPLFLQQLRERYDAFTMPAGPASGHDVSLRVTLTPMPGPARPINRWSESEARPLTVKTEARSLRVQRWDLDATLTSRQGRRPASGWRGKARCEMNPFTFDCLLRVIWSTLLPRVGGMLIHSCGLRHAAVGVVFPGRSGAGKTTLARKAPEADDVLSDELVAVRRVEDGWRVFGTPFWGDFARGGISMRSWPLRTIGFLAQAPSDTVTMTPIHSSDATLRLLGCLLCFSTDRAVAEENLAVAVALCSDVRAVEASLTRKVGTAAIFRKLTPHLGPEVTRQVPPASAREMISEFRSFLRKHRSYAFRPKGAELRPWMKGGDTLKINAAPGAAPAPGDIVLTWTPGASPDEDRLTCERVPAGRTAGARPSLEVLGTVSALSRDGRTLPLSGRVNTLGRAFGPLVAMPILRLAGR